MHLLERLSQTLMLLGIPGLFAIALLDSAAIPLVGGPDGIVIILAWQRPAQSAWIVLAAALGSVIGCLVLYRIARAGGERALARVSPKKQEWVKRQVEQNGFLTVFLAVIVPPPFPTKLVILAAGAFRTPLASLVAAVSTGRLIRYSFMAYLGSRFGGQAAEVIRGHYVAVLLSLAALALLIVLARRFLRPSSAPAD